MLKSIGIGAELFHKLIDNDCCYPDKTPLIEPCLRKTKPTECSLPDQDVSVNPSQCPLSRTFWFLILKITVLTQ